MIHIEVCCALVWYSVIHIAVCCALVWYIGMHIVAHCAVQLYILSACMMSKMRHDYRKGTTAMRSAGNAIGIWLRDISKGPPWMGSNILRAQGWAIMLSLSTSGPVALYGWHYKCIGWIPVCAVSVMGVASLMPR